jgi:hypothetical protein
MENFKNELLNKLEQLTKDTDCTVACDRFTKPNDTICEAINLHYPDKPLCANYYVNQLYHSYQDGKTIDELALYIFTHSQNLDMTVNVTETLNLVEALENFDFIQDKLAVRLYSLHLNKEYLQDKFFIPFLEAGDGKYEFAICFYAVVESTEEGIGSIPILRQIREKWNVSDAELLKQTVRLQEKKFPAVMTPIEKAMKKLLQIPSPSEDKFSTFMNPPKNDMYVLTNKKGVNGATVLLYKNFLKSIAEQFEDDFYILPSSTYEVIILSVSSMPHAFKHLTAMIHEVNQSCVHPTEILSDHLLYYSRKNHTLNVWTEENE